MSKFYDAATRAEAIRDGSLSPEQEAKDARAAWQLKRDFQVVAVTSKKGGVGKTTVATNLAVYLRALRDDLPVLLLGFDDQMTLDRMFSPDAANSREDPRSNHRDMASALRDGTFTRAARMGQYGVHFVPTHRDVAALRELLRGPDHLRRILLRTGWKGLVLIDTKSDFEVLTQSAIEVSDLSIVVVKDQVSLVEARRVFDLLAQRGTPSQQARVLLSLVDLRIKYREGENIDILAHLVSEIRREGYPLFETFVSRSPKIEALYTNPKGHAHSILQGAPESVVHGQMRELAEDVLRVLEGSARKAVSVRPSPAPSESPVSATGSPAPSGFARARPRPDGSSSVRTLLRGT